nr:MAG TPA: hypothetical protein [Caudoviricetes sp.]
MLHAPQWLGLCRQYFSLLFSLLLKALISLAYDYKSLIITV